MSGAQLLGDRGDRIDLQIQRGADFGPMTETLYSYSDTTIDHRGPPLDLAGSRVVGAIWRDGDPEHPLVTFEATVLAASAGEITWGLDHTQTAALPRQSGAQPVRLAWARLLIDSLGRRIPLSYGEVSTVTVGVNG